MKRIEWLDGHYPVSVRLCRKCRKPWLRDIKALGLRAKKKRESGFCQGCGRAR